MLVLFCNTPSGALLLLLAAGGLGEELVVDGPFGLMREGELEGLGG